MRASRSTCSTKDTERFVQAPGRFRLSTAEKPNLLQSDAGGGIPGGPPKEEKGSALSATAARTPRRISKLMCNGRKLVDGESCKNTDRYPCGTLEVLCFRVRSHVVSSSEVTELAADQERCGLSIPLRSLRS